MTLDHYQQCPCGSGKKIKFCCSKDIAVELEKPIRAIEGEQRVAAIDQINKLLTTAGKRPCLLALKCQALLDTGDLSALEDTVVTFLGAAPGNPLALAMSAVIDANRGNSREAVDQLQSALENVSGKHIPAAIYEALGAVANALSAEGDYLAALGHLLLQSSMSRGKDEVTTEKVFRLLGVPGVPLVLKRRPDLAVAPGDAPWAEALQQANAEVYDGKFRAARQQLEALHAKYPQTPQIVHNLAVVSGWLADVEQACAWWRRYSRMDGVNLDDAVEAEATAQILDKSHAGIGVDEVLLTYNVGDSEKLMERLLSHQRCSKMRTGSEERADTDEPPPKCVFLLLDRPLPASGAGLSLDAVPCVLGRLAIFGKQTDRPARLEFLTHRDDQFPDVKADLAELLEGLSDGTPSESVTGQIHRGALDLTWRWRLPDDTPIQDRERLFDEKRRERLFQHFPAQPLPVLGGKSPAEAAAEPANRIPLLAVILNIEEACQATRWDIDMNPLREQLGLPASGPIELPKLSLDEILPIPPIRLARLVPESLDDETLVSALRAASFNDATAATRNLAREFIRRDLRDEVISQTQVYQWLVNAAPTSAEAIELIEQARQRCREAGMSVVHWLLEELDQRIQRGEVSEVKQLVDQIRTRHLREPGVAESLYQMLLRYGLIRPAMSEVAPAATAAASHEEAPPAAGKLWTPDSEPDSTGGPPKQLWTPGTD